jgi:hypothetical protein
MQSALYSLKKVATNFYAFMQGSVVDYYDNTLTYSVGSRAKDYWGVYESQANGNTGNALSNTTWWVKVLDSYIGVNKQLNYNGNKIVYELALNDWFNTTFRQYADAAYTPLSDIYITTGAPAFTTFVVGDTVGSTVGDTMSSGYIGDTPTYTVASTYKYTINVPVSVYNSLGATATIRDKAFRQFADRLKPSGMIYTINAY